MTWKSLLDEKIYSSDWNCAIAAPDRTSSGFLSLAMFMQYWNQNQSPIQNLDTIETRNAVHGKIQDMSRSGTDKLFNDFVNGVILLR